MCGFSTYLYLDYDSKNGKPAFPRLDLDASLESIKSRGPDSRGTYVSPCGRCALGHVRLSIIDLEGGKQPLSNHANTIHAVVNGELYDHDRLIDELTAHGHQFKTRSDSELALHFYEDFDVDFVQKLRGEFTVTIWDERKKQFIVARDRFGIKPVYYTIYNGIFMVASEIKAFLALGWKPEWDLNSIGVYKVPPAHYMTVSASGSIVTQQYWDAEYPDKRVEDTRSVDEMIKGVHDRFLEAVRLRLRADVPLGIYLSGGLDSSAVAGVATHLLRQKDPNAKVEAFSISFTDAGIYDEGYIAERTAKFCDANLHKMSVTQEEMVENFEEAIWHTEQPSSNLNTVGKFMLSRFVRDKGYKVVMTGEGSDEHFIGYSFFQNDYLREPDHSSPGGFGTIPDEKRQKMLRQKMLDECLEMGFHFQKRSKTAHRWCNSTMQDVMCRFGSLNVNFYNQNVLDYHGMPEPATSMLNSLSAVTREKARQKWHSVHSALYLASRTFLPNVLCNHLGDRIEMAHSIEARTPFLDHPLCEYVNSLPPSVKLRGLDDGNHLNEKWILKKAMEPYITQEIFDRTKHPYIAPASNPEEDAIVKILNKWIVKEKIDKLGFIKWDFVQEQKELLIKTGHRDAYKDMLVLMSYCILSDRFGIPPAYF
ncbi:asparagine synthetase [Gongronella butleri]|nr:asparagine synthetase [Gongronella butleri]